MAERRQTRFPLIDGLRGCAALSVLVYHGLYKAYLSRHGSGVLADMTEHLDVGVTIFFVVSGFVLYRPFVAARRGGHGAIDTNAYGMRRLTRIVPAYWAVLIVVGLAGQSYPGSPSILSPWGAPYYFGFLQIYDPNVAGGGINVAWTLCVEASFYVFLPCWAGLLRRRGIREVTGLGALFIASVAWQVVATSTADVSALGSSGAAWIEPLPNFLDQFALGMLLAVAVTDAAGRPRAVLGALGRRPVGGLAVAGVAYAGMSFALGLGRDGAGLSGWNWLVLHQLKSVVAVCLVAVAVAGRGWLTRPLASRPVRFAGRISYGLYLVHVPIFVALARAGMSRTDALSAGAFLAVGLTLSVLSATVLHVTVERPAMRWARRRATRTSAALPAPPAIVVGA